MAVEGAGARVDSDLDGAARPDLVAEVIVAAGVCDTGRVRID